MEKSAKGIVGREAPAEGPDDERRGMAVKGDGNASDNRNKPAVASPRDEPAAGEPRIAESIPQSALLDRVLTRANLQRALKQVRRNQGAPGIDGMTVDELPQYLKEHWPEIRAQLVAGTYCPQPVRRVEIPKPDGTTQESMGINGVRLD